MTPMTQPPSEPLRPSPYKSKKRVRIEGIAFARLFQNPTDSIVRKLARHCARKLARQEAKPRNPAAVSTALFSLGSWVCCIGASGAYQEYTQRTTPLRPSPYKSTVVLYCAPPPTRAKIPRWVRIEVAHDAQETEKTSRHISTAFFSCIFFLASTVAVVVRQPCVVPRLLDAPRGHNRWLQRRIKQ